MKFKSIKINNFRNFKSIEINLDNKNIFFGLNDVGKTNFLYALRFVFDPEVRKNNMQESDFHCKNINEKIQIIVEIDISDYDEDAQKIRAKIKGAISSEETIIYIKLLAEYNLKELNAVPILYWGGDINDLSEISQRGYYYEIDRIFNIIYIDSYTDMYSLFKKNINKLVINTSPNDDKIKNEINDSISKMNDQISSLSGIKDFETKISSAYKTFRDENIDITIKSEIAIKGLFSNIVPYIKVNGDSTIYPTSGDGRKKLLSYSIYDLLSVEQSHSKINLFMIEEPENHLHKSMQIALSNRLFSDDIYKYLFMTTHSSNILYEMDNVNLIRIFFQERINSSSVLYNVPDEFIDYKKILNKSLAEAIFAERVLLVEGTSELLLFEKILSVLYPLFESKGIYILSVEGIAFKKYYTVLENLQIRCSIKTDNDFRAKKNGEFSYLGFSRCNDMSGDTDLPTTGKEENSVNGKRKLFKENAEIINKNRKKFGIYLSQVDLENDLDEFFHDKLKEYLNKEDPVKYLQEAKKNNMNELIKFLTKEDCQMIIEHPNFACLKEIII